MTREEARSKIMDLYPIEADSKAERALDFLLDLIYGNGLVLTKALPDLTSTDVAEFEQTVFAWITNDKIEQEDVSGPAIIQALQTRGWVILPPS